MSCIRYISAFDLLSVEEAKEIVANDDYTKFYDLLFDIGFDINREIEFQEVYCRSLINHNIICLGRWIGFERVDKEWINSEYCTFENKLLYREDKSMVMELAKMSNVPNFTGMLVEHIEENIGKGIPVSMLDEEDAIIDMMLNNQFV